MDSATIILYLVIFGGPVLLIGFAHYRANNLEKRVKELEYQILRMATRAFMLEILKQNFVKKPESKLFTGEFD